jgi:hypothetical protein
MKKDAGGFLGRECPRKGCFGYFKVTPGTGIRGPAACHCPYCGHAGSQKAFWTRDQIEYAKSVAIHRVADAIINDLKAMASRHRGRFGAGIRLQVKERPRPIRYYREKRLETEVTCDRCTLRYAIYGAFGFCPDCGVHNSPQILNKNLDLAEKQVALAGEVDSDLANHLTGNALEDAVSSFDGFGRETCRVRAASAKMPTKADNVSFQNLGGARQRLQELFAVDLAACITTGEWDFACRCFQKRHLLAHKMGVVDEAYLRAAADPAAVLGRKVTINSAEVVTLIALLRNLGASLVGQLPNP